MCYPKFMQELEDVRLQVRWNPIIYAESEFEEVRTYEYF